MSPSSWTPRFTLSTSTNFNFDSDSSSSRRDRCSSCGHSRRQASTRIPIPASWRATPQGSFGQISEGAQIGGATLPAILSTPLIPTRPSSPDLLDSNGTQSTILAINPTIRAPLEFLPSRSQESEMDEAEVAEYLTHGADDTDDNVPMTPQLPTTHPKIIQGLAFPSGKPRGYSFTMNSYQGAGGVVENPGQNVAQRGRIFSNVIEMQRSSSLFSVLEA